MKEAWGKWGDNDEAGALNLIGADEVRHAAALVSDGRVFSLAQPISQTMMMPKHRPGMMHFMGRDGGDYAAGGKRPGGFQFSEDTVVMPLHTGTHLDALCHCWYDDTLYNGFSADEVKSKGAGKLGVDKMPPVVTRGVLLDFTRDGAGVPDGEAIDLAMLKMALSRAETELRCGDAVLLRTGWFERQSGKDTDFNAEPGLNVEAARYLAEAGVAMIGADNYAIEVLPFAKDTVFPVHQLLIRDFAIPLLEGLVLKPLAEAGASTFLFVVAPLPIRGGTGSPVNPVAVL
jgi:kynurenine formamidase